MIEMYSVICYGVGTFFIFLQGMEMFIPPEWYFRKKQICCLSSCNQVISNCCFLSIIMLPIKQLDNPLPAPPRKFLVVKSCKKLTVWSKTLLGKLMVPQKVDKVFTFYGTQRFITMLATAYHFSLF
jgi:hypothetical protein